MKRLSPGGGEVMDAADPPFCKPMVVSVRRLLSMARGYLFEPHGREEFIATSGHPHTHDAILARRGLQEGEGR